MAPLVAVAILGLAVATFEDLGIPRPTVSVIRLVWFDPSDLAPGSEAVARAETARLLARMGATARWLAGTPGEVNSGQGLPVILLGEGPTASDADLLGATHRRHVVWVRVPNVRAAVGIAWRRPVPGLSPGEQRVLGVALGRVIAHEVVHAVVPSLPHRTGLMADSLGRRQLAAASIPIDPETARALRAALGGAPAPAGAVALARGARAGPEDR